MITTTTDHFEVFGDATTLELAERFEDVLAAPVVTSAEFAELLAPTTITIRTSAIAIPPSEVPAHELPYIEPSEADLRAIELLAEDELDERLAEIDTLLAFEQRRRELQLLRATLPAAALVEEYDDEDLERAA